MRRAHVYYNENDPRTAAWLRELVKEKAIAHGSIDERSIEDIRPRELVGFSQHHFFAGIGGWSAALRLAGWPDHKAVCTGSCPCQPYSQAGKKLGIRDERHLWPAFLHVISVGQPSIVLGEQVASPDGRAWLASVQADLEGLGYAFGAADLCAAGIGSPQKRNRLYFVADANRGGWAQRQRDNASTRHRETTAADSQSLRMGNANGARRGRDTGSIPREEKTSGELRGVCMGDSDSQGRQRWFERRIGTKRGNLQLAAWASGVALRGRDGRDRLVEPGTFPLAHGIPDRVGLLRGYGNAIVPQVAATFIKAVMGIR